MKRIRWSRRTICLTVIATLASSSVVACGGDDAVDEDGANSVAEPAVTADDQSTEPSPAGFTIPTLCDALAAEADGFVGEDAETSHNDFFVDDENSPVLTCSWYGPSSTRELRVIYRLSDTWAGVPRSGVATIDGFEAEHVYRPGDLYVRTPNGWEIDVLTWEGTSPEPIDVPDEAVAVATKALAALAAAL